MDPLGRLAGWEGTAEELVSLLGVLISSLSLPGEAPNVRTVRLWRTEHVLSKTKPRRFTEREALEVLAMLRLTSEGLRVKAASVRMGGLDNDGLRAVILQSASVTPASGERLRLAEMMVVLLAQGVSVLYPQVESGQIVRQSTVLPASLLEGMTLLGRLYLEEHQQDKGASVHEVLDRCRRPCRDWGLGVLETSSFPYRDTILIEPDLFLPTTECEDLARRSGGLGLEQQLEERLHAALREAIATLPGGHHRAYTAIRQYLGEHSLTTRRQLQVFCDEADLNMALTDLLSTRFYRPVPEAWLFGGEAVSCAHCGTLLRPQSDRRRYPDGKCPLRACHAVHSPAVGWRVPATDALVCTPALLNFWVNPAIDELKIFHEARQRLVPAELYPRGDAVDIELWGTTGVDVKAYLNPVTLALRLNEGGLDRLLEYPPAGRVLAVPDALASDGYLAALRGMLDPARLPGVRVLRVGQLIQALREGRHV
jgi:pPIWI_RE three-gene island domain Y/REase associating with pPIWI_RE